LADEDYENNLYKPR
jgi:hypothetical protein